MNKRQENLKLEAPLSPEQKRQEHSGPSATTGDPPKNPVLERLIKQGRVRVKNVTAAECKECGRSDRPLAKAKEGYVCLQHLKDSPAYREMIEKRQKIRSQFKSGKSFKRYLKKHRTEITANADL